MVYDIFMQILIIGEKHITFQKNIQFSMKPSNGGLEYSHE